MEIWWLVLIAVSVVILLSALLAVGNFASEKFMDAYEKMFQVPANVEKTVLELITEQNYNEFGGKLKVVRTQRVAGDAYSSKNKALILTDATLSSNSVGAFAVVAHELGHAQQDFTSKKFKTMKVLNTLGWIAGKLFLPSVIAFLVLLFFENLFVYSMLLAGVGGGIFLFAVFMKLMTIRLEKDASSRAIKMLDHFVPDNQMKEIKKFLKTARLTYWSDLVRLLFGWSGLVRKTKMFR